MNFFKCVLICALFLLPETVVLSDHVESLTEYRFFYKHKYENHFVLGKDIFSTPKPKSVLIHLEIDEDNHPHETHTSLKIFRDWIALEGMSLTVESDEHEILTQKDSKFVSKDYDFEIQAPSYSAKHFNFYHEQLNGKCARVWNDTMGADGISLPKISNYSGELIYVDPNGFYFNYTVKQAIIFPYSKFLLVFTENSNYYCSHKESHNGFMLFKLSVN